MRKRLAKHGLPEPILAQWEKRFGGKLLPLQYRAVTEYRLLEGASLLISAPTSSGKTFCGEMALVRAVQNRKKAIFLVPLKAVAEEKYRHFSKCYGGLGLRTVIATRDHPESDGLLESGRFDIAVMVYEKFNSLLLVNFDLMSQVATIVVDELQMLEDETRGAQLELTLTKLLYSKYSPQLIALSAVLGEATELAEWLGCRLLLEKMRPVELRRGVASEGQFCFRCHNSGELGEEACQAGEDVSHTLFENIKEALASHRQVLVFLKSRRETAMAARRFAEYARLECLSENEKFLDDRLADEEDSSLLKNLRSLLAVGVAFHNADLTAAQRLAVEEGYRAGLVNVIFATTTLSTGINLPAATVFIEAQKYRRQEYGGHPGLEPLSWTEYESMSGRAGRIGLMEEEGDSGRAVLLASNELEKSILWEYYIDKQPSPIASRLLSRDMADILIDLFGSGLVRHLGEVADLLNHSYCYCSNNVNTKDITATYKALLEDGFLVRQSDSVVVTPLGMAVAITGFTTRGAKHILKKSPLPESAHDIRFLYHIFQSHEGRSVYLPSSSRSGRMQFSEHFSAASAEDNPLIRDLTAMRRELTHREKSCLKLTLLVDDWMGGMSALDIENIYDLHPGMMENLGYQTGWLLASAASIIRAHDRFSQIPARLDNLVFSVKNGLPPDFKELHRDFGDLLFRSEWLALKSRGIIDRRQLLDQGCSVLAGMVSSEDRLRKIEKRIQKIKEDKMQTNHGLSSASLVWPKSIEIDGTPVRERFQIHINGQPINLTGKSFKYLLRLVWSRLTKDNGWLYKEDLEKGFNQARYLYRLRQEIGRNFMPDWPLYENNRSGYYRLAVGPDKLKVNIDALKEIPDYEIQQMALDLTTIAGH
jgi:replicative superfamily II helicase